MNLIKKVLDWFKPEIESDEETLRLMRPRLIALHKIINELKRTAPERFKEIERQQTLK